MLSAIRTGLVRAVLPDAQRARPQLARRRASADGAIDVRFCAAFDALKGTVVRVPTLEATVPAVADIAVRHGAASFLAWDDEALGCHGFAAGLASLGLRRIPADLPAAPPARLDTLRMMGSAGLGVTGADAALADTGSLVLLAGPGRGRLVSALPPVHVALVPIDRLTPDLAGLIEARPGLLDESSNAVVITGPSRTADIEMTLTHGVHGPKHVYALLIG